MQLGTGWLDYGMAGLLALVLVGVGLFLRELVRKANEKDAATQKFMQDMITTANEERAAHMVAWQTTTEKVIATQEKNLLAQDRTIAALEKVTDTMEGHCKEAEVRHRVVVGELRNLRSAQEGVK